MKGWRTILFNLVGIATLLSTSEFVGLVPPGYLPYVTFSISIGNLILRTFATTTPVGEKE